VSDVIVMTEDEIAHIMKGLYVVLGADGAVHVHGIPNTVTNDVRDGVARVAADAATQRLDSVVRFRWAAARWDPRGWVFRHFGCCHGRGLGRPPA
jgi:hypothetical protein